MFHRYPSRQCRKCGKWVRSDKPTCPCGRRFSGDHLYRFDFVYNGKRKREVWGVAENAMAPNEAFGELLRAISKGTYRTKEEKAAENVHTLGSLQKWYLALPAVKDRGARSLATKEWNLCNAVEGIGEALPANELSPKHVANYQESRKARKRANGTINADIAQLQAMLNAGVRQGEISQNPITGAERLRQPPPRTRTLEPEEELTLYRAATSYPTIRDMLIVARYTGMRWGEIDGLNWSEVDMGRNCVVLAYGRTKEKGEKTIPLMIQGRDGKIYDHALQAIRRQPRGIHGRVFLHRGRSPKRRNVHKHEVQKINKAAGLKDFRTHDLRGTFIVWMETYLRYSERVIMAITGHSPRSRQGGFDSYQGERADMALSVMGGQGRAEKWDMDPVAVYFKELREVG